MSMMRRVYPNPWSAFTVTELIIVIIIILILAAIAIPNFLEGDYPAKVSKTKSDSRTLATAIESYFVDHKCYPAMRPLRSFVTTNRGLKRLEKAGGLDLMTIEPGRPDIGLSGLTTPVAYIEAVPADSLAKQYLKLEIPIAYYTDGPGWILISPGRDKDYDARPSHDYDGSIPQPSPHLLITGTYDPTNGSESDGDVWRMKQ